MASWRRGNALTRWKKGASQSVAEKLWYRWETLALDRPAWRSKVNKGTPLFEQSRIAGAQRKHELRKSKAISLTPAQESHQSPKCDRAFRACIHQPQLENPT